MQTTPTADSESPPLCPSECPASCLDPTTIRKHLAEQLKAWRLADGHTIDSLAAVLGVSRSTISLWESAKRFPSLEHLTALALVMNKKLIHLFCPHVQITQPPLATASDKKST